MLRVVNRKTQAKSVIRRVVKENLSMFFADLGAEMHYSTEKTQVFTGINGAAFNGVLRANIPTSIVTKRIHEITNQFKNRNLPFYWIVSSDSKPQNIAHELLNEGLDFHEEWVGFFYSLEQTPLTYFKEPIQVVPIYSYQTMDLWVSNLSEFLELPTAEAKRYGELFVKDGVKPFRHFVVLIDNEYVGTATLYFQKDYVGIYNFSVKKERRNLGVGKKIVAQLLHHAKKTGAKGAILYAPKVTEDSFLQQGFDSVIQLKVFTYTNPNCFYSPR